MVFNDKWTREVNDEYRRMIKENRSYDEIKDHFGNLLNYHPKNKFKFNTVLTYDRFNLLINEIRFNPNYTYFEYNKIQSLRFPGLEDIICFFEIEKVEYVLVLECLIENNKSFNNQKVYNIFFTTEKQYNDFKDIISNIKNLKEIEDKFVELQNILESPTGKHHTIKIFNSLSYISLKMKNHIENCIYMISETDDIRKFNFYKKSIEDSFKEYELIVDESIFFPGKKSYYYKLESK